MVGMARRAVPARVVAGGTNVLARDAGMHRSCAAARGADIAARCPYHASELFGIGGGNSRSGSLQCLLLEMQTSALSKLGQRTQPPPISWLMQLALDHPHLISLAAGFTDNPSLPVEETRALLNEILG